MDIGKVINLERYPIKDPKFAQTTKEQLAQNSYVQLDSFLQSPILEMLVSEAQSVQHQQFCRRTEHNIFMKPNNNHHLPQDHIFHRKVVTTKGCVTTDQIPEQSFLKRLYYNETFQKFLTDVLEIEKLYDYKDPLSSVTLHYGSEGQELGWHFDNSAFAITLLLQKPKEGGVFEFIPNIREPEKDHDGNNEDNVNYPSTSGPASTSGGKENRNRRFKDEIKEECINDVHDILNGKKEPKQLDLNPGTLVLFRGRDSLHRVSKVVGDSTRILTVLAYNEVPNVKLPDDTMMAFFGRVA